MNTALLFRDDAYLAQTTARVVAINEQRGIELDRTVFYATSGGQPGDSGVLIASDGTQTPIVTTVHPDGDKTRVVHVPAEDAPLPPVGGTVTLTIDWDRRHRLMRMHTALHLATVIFPFPITGAQVGTDKGRVDFDMAEAPEDVAALEAELNRLVSADHPVVSEWIEDSVLDANPDLVKSLHVAPPRGQGRVRLVRIGSPEHSIDLQPCGGTHVRSTGEIGALRIGKLENKGRQNRRVTLYFLE